MITEKNISKEIIWKWLEEIPDPEIPVLSIVDLGIVKNVIVNDNRVEIIITSTYSGCPAMDMIKINIKMTMAKYGLQQLKITEQLSPAWTTDWMNEEARQKLIAYGIAPPLLKNEHSVKCPQCHSTNTRLISQFGSTPCKSLYQCNDCKEPFDYFKCH